MMTNPLRITLHHVIFSSVLKLCDSHIRIIFTTLFSQCFRLFHITVHLTFKLKKKGVTPQYKHHETELED